MEWLEWKIRKAENGIDGVVESAVRALESLGIDEEEEIAKVRIFWRVATTIRDAGMNSFLIPLLRRCHVL